MNTKPFTNMTVVDAYDQDDDELDEVSCITSEALIDNGRPLISIAIHERETPDEVAGSVWISIDDAQSFIVSLTQMVEKARELCGGGPDAFERAARALELENAKRDVKTAKAKLRAAEIRLSRLA